MKDIKSVSSSSVNMKLDNYKESHRDKCKQNHTKFSKEQIQIEKHISWGKGRLPVIGELVRAHWLPGKPEGSVVITTL